MFEDPAPPLAVIVTGKETVLSAVTVSVVENVIEEFFVPLAGMSFAGPDDENITVATHAPLHPAGAVTDEHVQFPPAAGVAT